MQVRCLPLGAYQTNCYLVWAEDSPSCVVIDPGFTPEVILEKVAALGKTVEAVFLTHGHFDHVGGARAIVEKTGCALWMQEGDWSIRSGFGIKQLFPLANCDFCPVQFYEHGQVVSAAGLDFTVWQTPGHTHGSVCIGAEKVLFTGDTLFAGSIGRTDFPGSSWTEMESSLAFLMEQKRDYTIYPGHGEASNLLFEQQTNPYMNR